MLELVFATFIGMKILPNKIVLGPDISFGRIRRPCKQGIMAILCRLPRSWPLSQFGRHHTLHPTPTSRRVRAPQLLLRGRQRLIPLRTPALARKSDPKEVERMKSGQTENNLPSLPWPLPSYDVYFRFTVTILVSSCATYTRYLKDVSDIFGVKHVLKNSGHFKRLAIVRPMP